MINHMINFFFIRRLIFYIVNTLIHLHFLNFIYLFLKTIERKEKKKRSSCNVAIMRDKPKKYQWIHDSISKDLCKKFIHLGNNCSLVNLDSDLSPYSHIFYLHYISFFHALLSFKKITIKKNIVYFTHHEKETSLLSIKSLSKLLNLSDVVICLNSKDKEFLKLNGVNVEIRVVIIGADRNLFKYHKRQNKGNICFVSAFYDRKNPEFICNIVKSLSSYNFFLLGPRWNSYKNFNQMLKLNNFKYLELSYDQYPNFYNTMDIFISVSFVEGGPVPLVEAMMSNLIPISSDTGHARDLIQDGHNGYILKNNNDLSEIQNLIQVGLRNPINVRDTVTNHTWDKFLCNLVHFSINS